MGLGTNTIEGAKKDGRPMGDVGEFRSRIKLNDRTPIKQIRTLQITNFYILLVGSTAFKWSENREPTWTTASLDSLKRST